MKQALRLMALASGIALVVGCSNGSNDNNDTNDGADNTIDTGNNVDNGTDTTEIDGNDTDGSGNEGSDTDGDSGTVDCGSDGADTSVLGAIGAQARESDPADIDVTALSATLGNLANGCAQADPALVNEGESVNDVIMRINTRG